MQSESDILAGDACARDMLVAVDANRELTVGQLRRKVAAAAIAVDGLGSERWMPLAENALDFAIAFFGILSAGRTVVLPSTGRVEAASDASLGIQGVLADRSVTDLPVPVIDLADLQPGVEKVIEIDPEARLELFTSGSTGKPKRVVKQFRQLVDEVEVLEATFGSLLGDSVVLATVPHYHIYGLLFRILWPVQAGRAFHASQTLTPAVRAGESSMLIASPAFLKRLVEPENLRRDRLRAIFSSGGALDPDEAVALSRAAACPLIEVYGSTETGGIAWRQWPGSNGGWRFFDGVEYAFGKMEEGRAGRLHVRSSATGNEWMDTGDLVAMKDDTFQLFGRADGVLKVEDKRVSLAALESCLGEHPRVRTARVLLLDGRRDELAAVIELEGNCGIAEARDRRQFAEELKRHLAQRFDRVAMPRRWRFVPVLPVNAMGKTTHSELIELFGERDSS